LGTKTAAEVLELIDQAETCGLDVMSAGVTLGWAAEAYSQGLITNEQTLVPLSFGDTRSFLKAIEYIGLRKNEFYRVLGEGVDYASSIYGGRDYAMALCKNEITGYHTGYGAIIGQAVGARHSHLCNAGYSFDQSMKEFDAQKLTAKIFEEEKERCMLNSLCICLFARKVYDRETVLAALKALGVEFSDEDLTRIGRDIFNLKMKIKDSMGFKFENLTFPQRFFETPALSRKLDAETAYMLRDMYSKMVEDQMNGE
jgi:aldehyde:ferredoxin oxidoreductase